MLSAATLMSLAGAPVSAYDAGYNTYPVGTLVAAAYPDDPNGYTVPDVGADNQVYAMAAYNTGSDEYLYIYDVANRNNSWNAQVKIYKVTDRKNMTYLGYIQCNEEGLMSRAKAIEIIGNKMIVVSGQSFVDVCVYDLTNPEQPVLMAKYVKESIHEGGGYVSVRDFYVDEAENKVYVPNIKGYIYIADLSQLPSNPDSYGQTLYVTTTPQPITFDGGKTGIYSIEKSGEYLFLGTAGKTSNGIDGNVTGDKSEIIVARAAGNNIEYVAERSIDLNNCFDFSADAAKAETYRNRNVSNLEIIGNCLYAIYDPCDANGYTDVITAIDISQPQKIETANIKYNYETVSDKGNGNSNRGVGRLNYIQADKQRKALLGVGFDYTNIFDAADGLYVFSKLATWNGPYRIDTSNCGALSGNRIYIGYNDSSPRCYEFTINDFGLSKYGFGFTPQAENTVDWYNMSFSKPVVQGSDSQPEPKTVKYTFDVYSAGNYFKNAFIKYKHNAGKHASFNIEVNGKPAGTLQSNPDWGYEYSVRLDNVLLRDGHNDVAVEVTCDGEICLDFLGFESISEYKIDNSNVFENSYYYDFEDYEEVVNSAPYTYHYHGYTSVSNNGYAGSQGALEVDGRGFNMAETGFSMQNVTLETNRDYTFALKVKILNPSTTGWCTEGAVDEFDMTHYGTLAVMWNGSSATSQYINWGWPNGRAERIDDGWYQLYYDFKIEPAGGEKSVTLSFYEFRIGGENTRFLADDWSIMPKAAPAEIGTDYVEGAAVGDTITVDYPNSSDDMNVYRYDYYVSEDGENWAHIAGGNDSEASSASYTLTEKEAGKYVKAEVLCYNRGEQSYTVYTKKTSAKVLGTFERFTSTFLNDTIAAEGFIELPSNSGIGILAQYDADGKLISTSIEDITSGKVAVSAAKEDGAVQAKLFVWDEDNLHPYDFAAILNDGTFERVNAIKDATIDASGNPAVPENVTFIPSLDVQLSSGSTARALIFDSVDYKGKKVSVFAYMSVPEGASADEPVPAIVLLHGQGGEADTDWMAKWDSRGYAVIATDWMSYNGASHIDEASQALGREIYAGPICPVNYFADTDYEQVKDQWMYRAVCGAILARNLLASQPQVDKDKVGIAGISFGGIISTYVIGADPTTGSERFSFAIPAYLSGFYEEGVVKKMMGPNRQLWDSKYVLKNAKMPILFINSTRDDFNDIAATTMSYDETKPYSKLTIINGLGHGHPDAFNVSSAYDFADSIVKDGKGIADISHDVTVDGSRVTFDYTTKSAVKEIKLVYNEQGLAKVYSWESPWKEVITGDTLAADSSGTYEFTLPAGTKGFLFQLTDERQNVVSTRYVELN